MRVGLAVCVCVSALSGDTSPATKNDSVGWQLCGDVSPVFVTHSAISTILCAQIGANRGRVNIFDFFLCLSEAEMTTKKNHNLCVKFVSDVASARAPMHFFPYFI